VDILPCEKDQCHHESRSVNRTAKIMGMVEDFAGVHDVHLNAFLLHLFG